MSSEYIAQTSRGYKSRLLALGRTSISFSSSCYPGPQSLFCPISLSAPVHPLCSTTFSSTCHPALPAVSVELIFFCVLFFVYYVFYPAPCLSFFNSRNVLLLFTSYWHYWIPPGLLSHFTVFQLYSSFHSYFQLSAPLRMFTYFLFSFSFLPDPISMFCSFPALQYVV